MNPTIRSQWSANILTFPKLSLILGGAASGKSRFAEKLVTSAERPRSYLATAQAFDDEMRVKIEQHQVDRGENWTTIECPRALPEALKSVPNDGIILVDCLTLWLSNLMLAERDHNKVSEDFLTAAQAVMPPIVAVSNEVGHSVVPESSLGRRFQTAQGKLNQEIAAKADLVVFVTAGIPTVLKGTLPEVLS